MFNKIIRLFIAAWLFMQAPLVLAEKTDVPQGIDGTTRVSAEELIELISASRELVVIDARKNSDREKGYIEGSIGLPDTETTPESLASKVPVKSAPVAFYCNGVKCGRSVKSAKNAVAWGYTDVYWFRGGWEEWTEKGYPVSR